MNADLLDVICGLNVTVGSKLGYIGVYPSAYAQRQAFQCITSTSVTGFFKYLCGAKHLYFAKTCLRTNPELLCSVPRQYFESAITEKNLKSVQWLHSVFNQYPLKDMYSFACREGSVEIAEWFTTTFGIVRIFPDMSCQLFQSGSLEICKWLYAKFGDVVLSHYSHGSLDYSSLYGDDYRFDEKIDIPNVLMWCVLDRKYSIAEWIEELYPVPKNVWINLFLKTRHLDQAKWVYDNKITCRLPATLVQTMFDTLVTVNRYMDTCAWMFETFEIDITASLNTLTRYFIKNDDSESLQKLVPKINKWEVMNKLHLIVTSNSLKCFELLISSFEIPKDTVAARKNEYLIIAISHGHNVLAKRLIEVYELLD